MADMVEQWPWYASDFSAVHRPVSTSFDNSSDGALSSTAAILSNGMRISTIVRFSVLQPGNLLGGSLQGLIHQTLPNNSSPILTVTHLRFSLNLFDSWKNGRLNDRLALASRHSCSMFSIMQ